MFLSVISVNCAVLRKPQDLGEQRPEGMSWGRIIASTAQEALLNRHASAQCETLYTYCSYATVIHCDRLWAKGFS